MPPFIFGGSRLWWRLRPEPTVLGMVYICETNSPSWSDVTVTEVSIPARSASITTLSTANDWLGEPYGKALVFILHVLAVAPSPVSSVNTSPPAVPPTTVFVNSSEANVV